MIEAGVEDGLLVVRTFDVDGGKFLLPGIMSGAGVVVEVPRLRLCLHISTGSIVINGRDSHLGQYIFLIIGEAECGAECSAVDNIASSCITPAVHQDSALERTGELYAEIHFTKLSPASQDTEAFDGLVVEDAYLALNNLIGATSCVVGITTEGHTVEVEDDGLLLTFGERVLMDAGMNCCREFHVDILSAEQVNHIITRSRFLL